jgi:hypothetical protein
MLYLMGFDLLTGVIMLSPLALIDKRPTWTANTAARVSRAQAMKARISESRVDMSG